MTIERVKKISDLKSWITEQIRATPIDQFPKKVQYHEGLEEPVYTVCIEVTEQDFFIDKKGTKWLRAIT